MKQIFPSLTIGLIMTSLVLQGCQKGGEQFTQERVVVKAALCQEVTNQALPVEGHIPHWLNGTYVRNGPTHVQIGDQSIPHWFDGLAMLHGFCFHEGSVHYSNKFLRTSSYQEAFEEGDLNYAGFANPPCFNFFQKLKLALFSGKCDMANANVNVGKIANDYVAFTEIPNSVRFCLNNMNTIGPLRYRDDLPQSNIFESAHMQYDRRANEKLNYMVDFGIINKYRIYTINNRAPCREQIASMKVDCPSYMHSFAITERYVILVEFPFVVNSANLIFSNQPFIKNYVWIPERGTRFTIFDRRTGKHVRTLCDKPFFCLSPCQRLRKRQQNYIRYCYLPRRLHHR